MSDPVLTDDEKGALLEGMSSGEVEVHSTTGPSYASVSPFDIGPRSRIVTNSFPRLQALNRQFAGKMGKQAEVLLNAECVVTFDCVERSVYTEFCENNVGLSLVAEFEPKPLQGAALIHIGSDLVETLVETFFGGLGNESARQDPEFFTPGEINVAALFCRSVLATTSEVWQPLESISPTLERTHLSSGVIDCIDGSDVVLLSNYEISVAESSHTFQIVWPVNTIAPLIPVFDGQKRERDVAQDARWERALRSKVVDSVIRISSGVGHTRMTLGDVADFKAGDVINIGNPQKGTVFARKVPVLEGRFGVHDGRYAIEATNWIEALTQSGAAS